MTRWLPLLGVLVLAAGCAVPAREPVLPDLPNYLTGYPPITPAGLVHMVVEIPAGTNAKWETQKTGEGIEWELENGERRVVRYLAYPANYGMVPGTRLSAADGGDGDPLDIVLLGPAVERGRVVPVRVVGVLHLTDDGETDDKLIAVPDTGVFSEVRSLDGLDAAYPGVTMILETWFTNYKGRGRLVSKGFGTHIDAERVVERAIAGYSRERTGR